MTITTKRLGLAMAVALLISSTAAANEIYQWTDVNGIVHFTDSLHSTPESARNSPSFVVRKDLAATASNPVEVTPITSKLPTQPEVGRTLEPLEPMPNQVEATPVLYAPQEVTIVVVNSDTHRFKRHPCKHCRPAFRPDFNNRQYIHPSVFNGGSRQYIHPR